MAYKLITATTPGLQQVIRLPNYPVRVIAVGLTSTTCQVQFEEVFYDFTPPTMVGGGPCGCQVIQCGTATEVAAKRYSVGCCNEIVLDNERSEVALFRPGAYVRISLAGAGCSGVEVLLEAMQQTTSVTLQEQGCCPETSTGTEPPINICETLQAFPTTGTSAGLTVIGYRAGQCLALPIENLTPQTALLDYKAFSDGGISLPNSPDQDEVLSLDLTPYWQAGRRFRVTALWYGNASSTAWATQYNIRHRIRNEMYSSPAVFAQHLWNSSPWLFGAPSRHLLQRIEFTVARDNVFSSLTWTEETDHVGTLTPEPVLREGKTFTTGTSVIYDVSAAAVAPIAPLAHRSISLHRFLLEVLPNSTYNFP